MKGVLILLCVLFSTFVYSQEVIEVGDKNIRHFNISADNGDVDFIKVGSDTSQKKPVLLFLQGSLPVPLIIDYGDVKDLSSFPFNVSPILSAYHLIVISKPQVPLTIAIDSLKNGSIYTDPQRAYNKANHLETYIDRSNKVIAYLSEQSWVDQEKLIVFGHSEGSTIAVKLAMNPLVTHIALGASNPFGRIYESVIETRAKEDAGLVTPQEAQSNIDEQYNRWKHIVANKNDDTALRGDTFKATFSFSEYLVDDMIQMSQPLLVLYGTKDIGARSCDYLSIALTSAGKSNFLIMPHVGRGHNFESFHDNGQSNYDDMAWDEVIQELLNWAK